MVRYTQEYSIHPLGQYHSTNVKKSFSNPFISHKHFEGQFYTRVQEQEI